MTMPKTAELVKLFGGVMPSEMSDEQLDLALGALREDLPGDPIGYIHRMVPVSQRCGCGAVHLSVDDPELDDATRGSLHRLLATPFGEIPREVARRQYGFSSIRFGWSGLDAKAPTFAQLVTAKPELQRVVASSLSDGELDEVIAAIRTDLPGMKAMFDQSVRTRSVHAVSAAPGEDGARAWKALIDEVMFTFSTPLRKFLDEEAARRGVSVSAVNCCIIMAGEMNGLAWERQRFMVQTEQQLTPDC